jgi:TetR/AcrR family transcriptional regulator, mexJK operon transcriptional repressor
VTAEDAGEDQRRSARKRRAIVDAATEAFLLDGYRGTSMDQIAAAARVSKQTVYKHFADKEKLFAEIVTATVATAGDPVGDEVRRLADTEDLAADLHDLGLRQLKLVLRPRMMQLRRLVIAESARFPELGRTFYDRGAERTVTAFAETFTRLAERGLLRVEDAVTAARQFNWLIMAAPVNAAMLLGRDDPPPDSDLEYWVSSGVRTFLAAYGAN